MNVSYRGKGLTEECLLEFTQEKKRYNINYLRQGHN